MSMNHNPTEAFGLSAAALLAMDLENEDLVNPRESEDSHAFKRDVLFVLWKNNVTGNDLRRPVYGDGVWTLLQYLRNADVPWNVLVLLRNWDTRVTISGYDFVAAWIENMEFQGF